MNKKISVFLVDDHDMFRDGVKLLLSSENEAEVVAEARNGKEFLENLGKINPDIVLMDIAMPEMDGIEASRLALEKNPNLKILALTMYGDEKYYYQMIQTGIQGFVLKSSGISELTRAISEVYAGGNYFSNEILYKIIKNVNQNKAEENNPENNSPAKLTNREIDVLKLIVTGLSNEEIAEKLTVSLSTVKSHRSSLLAKTSSRNTASLVMYAIKNSIVEPN
ncbi:MAG: response regulator transcription factor [Bacteroidota bacterium]|nr:response regulator transcription factor [Bacteroidota bacterium]MDP4224953.1 response regulator transcription factor [Bacteroidota bacterium]MDP4274570.1 response regulator transcription factor [Bacteroidota bacterium]